MGYDAQGNETYEGPANSDLLGKTLDAIGLQYGRLAKLHRVRWQVVKGEIEAAGCGPLDDYNRAYIIQAPIDKDKTIAVIDAAIQLCGKTINAQIGALGRETGRVFMAALVAGSEPPAA